MQAWRLATVDGLLVVFCEPLLGVPGVAHAFSTRRADGRDDFDLGPAVSPDDDVLGRRERFLRAGGFAGHSPSVLKQVHGSRVVSGVAGPDPVEADGLVWTRETPDETLPSVRHADCVPLLIVDRRGRVGAAVHAGWRGTASGIASHAVSVLLSLGASPQDLLAALGPAIGPCCYEVGRDVSDAVGVGVLVGAKDGGLRLDLHAANRAQLERAGLAPGAIYEAPWCTRCRKDLFFSHRREGSLAGRMMASLGRARS